MCFSHIENNQSPVPLKDPEKGTGWLPPETSLPKASKNVFPSQHGRPKIVSPPSLGRGKTRPSSRNPVSLRSIVIN